MTPTSEQDNIIEKASCTSANLLINAYAGTGKTSTLEMIERVVDTKPILYLVFNKRNADEAVKRMLPTTTVRTLNSMGHRVWATSCASRLTIEPKKSNLIFKDLVNAIKSKPDRDVIWDSYWETIHAVGMAKAVGYVPEGKFPMAKRLCERSEFHKALEESPDELTADLIDAVLTESIKQSYKGTLDYNDQVYMPAIFGGVFPRFPLVKLDEAQDMSPINHLLIERLAKGRLIAVGDPFQNIYSFRGAKANGMQELKSKYSMAPCELSVSFRCPEAIVRNARWRVPNFKWANNGGHVECLKHLRALDIVESSAIICRNNAPLFRMAIHLLSAGRSVSLAGSDIGPKLLGLLRKLGPEDLPRSAAISAIADWEEERLAKESTTAADLAACMRVFVNAGTDLGQAIRYLEHIFGQKGTIRLITGHKAKGLEWDTVYHLDPQLLREDEQDLNLRYVIQTRSKDRYFEIESVRVQ